MGRYTLKYCLTLRSSLECPKLEEYDFSSRSDISARNLSTRFIRELRFAACGEGRAEIVSLRDAETGERLI